MPKNQSTQVIIKGHSVRFGQNELAFYQILKENKGEVVRFSTLEYAPFEWKPQYYRFLKTVVAEKLKGLEEIKTVYGVGYFLSMD